MDEEKRPLISRQLSVTRVNEDVSHKLSMQMGVSGRGWWACIRAVELRLLDGRVNKAVLIMDSGTHHS